MALSGVNIGFRPSDGNNMGKTSRDDVRMIRKAVPCKFEVDDMVRSRLPAEKNMGKFVEKGRIVSIKRSLLYEKPKEREYIPGKQVGLHLDPILKQSVWEVVSLEVEVENIKDGSITKFVGKDVMEMQLEKVPPEPVE